MSAPFDEAAFTESIEGEGCVATTTLTLQALQPFMDDNKAEVLATALCGVDTADTGASMDVFFLLFCGYLVFLMQAGFAMLCAGSVRSKNTMNILLKNVLDASVGAIMFYILGYGFAYGGDNGFIGTEDFALNETRTGDLRFGDGYSWASFFFQWAFSAAAATIVSGSVAERTTFIAYLGYSAFLTGFAYPVVVHWVWDGAGWLTAFRDDPLLDIGMIDYAGSGVVHMVGGVAGLMGAALVGPRMGRFDADGKPVTIRGHSATMVVLGTFLLWFGWYGFNPGSQLAIAGLGNASIVARTAVTTTLAPAAAGLTNLFLTKVQTNAWDLLAVCNGALGGLVSITAGCSTVEPWAAIIAGVIGAFVFNYSEKLLLLLKIDDPLSAAPMHGFCGAFGVLYVGFMAYQPYVNQVYGDFENHLGQGVFYGGNGRLLGCQVIGTVVIFAWIAVLLGAFFAIMKVAGLLRVSQEDELAGLDVSKHGGTCYEVTEPRDAMKEKPHGF